MRKLGGVAFGPDAGELLRARGLRVTPRRRAILGAFSHRVDEHVSADEIHARAAAVVPELGRGTVYAALAELTELGLLAAFGSRGGSRAARAHLAAAKAAVAAYFAGHAAGECTIDWDWLPGGPTLRAAMAVPRAQLASYDALDTPAAARERGLVLGANPLAILIPCHRVTRGLEMPGEYVGGAERRLALCELERS